MMAWTVFDACKARSVVGKSPWLAAALSWLIPGAGQLLAGAYLRGIAFVVFIFVSHAAQIVMLLSNRLSDTAALVLSVSLGAVLVVSAPVDAFRTVRRRRLVTCERRVPLRETYFPVFLTVILPGLGDLYMRRWIQGALIFVAFLLLRLALRGDHYEMVALVLLKALASLHVLVAGRQQDAKCRQRPVWLIVGLVTICAIGLYPVFLVQGRYFLLITQVDGNSMAPTVMKGSYLVVDKLAYRRCDPAEGDVVVLLAPTEQCGSPRQTCKRIVAVPGETVQVRDGMVFVNGEYRDVLGHLSRYIMKRAAKQTASFSYGVAEPFRVSSGHYFVLGDNRINSLDSRSYGPVSGKNIIGRVVRVYSVPRGRLPQQGD